MTTPGPRNSPISWGFLFAIATLLSPKASSAFHVKPLVDILGLCSHIGAAICATAELAEDVESIGHAHGMVLLGCSKVCRELNVLREAAVEEAEELREAHTGENNEAERSISSLRMILRPIDFLFRLTTSKAVAAALSTAALAAAFVEVAEDLQPGGHHGTLLLATNELFELLQSSRLVRQEGRVMKLLKNHALRLAVISGAMLLALTETVRSVVNRAIGAHHGVLLLAASKSLRCIGLLRGQLKEKDE